jgi:hypothetical protein
MATWAVVGKRAAAYALGALFAIPVLLAMVLVFLCMPLTFFRRSERKCEFWECRLSFTLLV